MKRTAAIVCLVLGALVLGWWAASGASLWTQTEVKEVTKVKDDFGDEVEKVTWHKKFVPGALDLAVPVDAALTVAAAVLLILDKKERQRGANPA